MNQQQQLKMSKLVKNDQWIWVLVNDEGGRDEFLGQHDQEKNISFIPAFIDKEEALKCYNMLVRNKNGKYQAQAILYEDLVYHCTQNRFMIFMLNSNGEIKEKISCNGIE